MSEHSKTRFNWDIRHYFARRGGERIQFMIKKTFALKTDTETSLSYIAKVVDEETKNHKETDQDIITGFMPEIPNSKMYPVQSFLTYLYSLSSECESLWQVPKFTDFPANPRIWTYYGPTPMGHNTLKCFVTKLAQDIGAPITPCVFLLLMPWPKVIIQIKKSWQSLAINRHPVSRCTSM